jgi:hypothetical protein
MQRHRDQEPDVARRRLDSRRDEDIAWAHRTRLYMYRV